MSKIVKMFGYAMIVLGFLGHFAGLADAAMARRVNVIIGIPLAE